MSGSYRAAVAAGHPCTVAAARAMLEAGGNAFDAVIAGGFASAVAEPVLTGLGGGGFLLARTAAKAATLFDFFVDTPGLGANAPEQAPHFLPVTVHFPGSEQIFNVGHGAIATPGCLAGYLHVQRKLGRLPLRSVLAPALRLAEEGLILSARQAYLFGLLYPIQTLTAAGRALYEPNGRFLQAGDRYRNPALANFLRRLPKDGGEDFYRGHLAEHIAADMRAHQGLLTAADLGGYEVKEREPLRLDYRDCQLLTNPPPSFGGGLVALGLELLQNLPDEVQDSPEQIAQLAAVMEETAQLRAQGIKLPEALDAAQCQLSRQRLLHATRGTTHISVCDAEGNAASMTTSNGEGSGYIAPACGIMLNNMLGEDDLHPDGFHSAPPGQRVASMMAPSLLLRDGDLALVLGSGGSKRIRTALLQVIRHYLDGGLALKAAIKAPRLHWDGDLLQLEPGFSDAVRARLQQRWPLNLWQVQDLYFGGVHAVSPHGEAAGDPRRGGAAWCEN